MSEEKKVETKTEETKNQFLQNVGKATNFAISFDTTGSMSSVIDNVRSKLQEIAAEMFDNIPGLKIAVIAHGDYCDGDNAINCLDFSNDLEEIKEFIGTVPGTCGGDYPECYELAMHKARSLSWPEEGGSFLMIGDAVPHEENPDNLNWRDELQGLVDKNIKVFAIQCLKSEHRSDSNHFWESIGAASDTPVLQLGNDFQDSAMNIEAIAFASAGAEAYDSYRGRSMERYANVPVSANSMSNMVQLSSYTARTAKEPEAE